MVRLTLSLSAALGATPAAKQQKMPERKNIRRTLYVSSEHVCRRSDFVYLFAVP